MPKIEVDGETVHLPYPKGRKSPRKKKQKDDARSEVAAFYKGKK